MMIKKILMPNKLCFHLFFILCAVGCGNSFTQIQNTKPPRLTVKSLPSVILKTTESQDLDISQITDRPVVIQFASDSCIVCKEEAIAMRKHLKDPLVAPLRVKIFSVIVGAFLEDAVAWKARVAVPWDVAMDLNSDLFKQVCEKDQVPCMVISLPERGIVFSRHGEVSISEIEALTGAWEN